MTPGLLVAVVFCSLFVLAAVGLLGAWLGSRQHRAAARAEVEGAEARSDLAHVEHVEEVERLSDEDLLEAITQPGRPRR